jgi:hypothetical protein
MMFGFFEHGKQARKDAEGARALGWASLAIGLTEMAAPKVVQNLLGIDDTPQSRGVLRVLGAREIAHGVGILSDTEPDGKLAGAVWARVAGDALDTALLAKAVMKTTKPASFALVSAAVMGIGLLDMYYAQRLTRDQMA